VNKTLATLLPLLTLMPASLACLAGRGNDEKLGD